MHRDTIAIAVLLIMQASAWGVALTHMKYIIITNCVSLICYVAGAGGEFKLKDGCPHGKSLLAIIIDFRPTFRVR